MAAHAQTMQLTSARRPLLAYWHLLSLDAPTVAIVWCVAFAHAADVRLPWFSPVSLGAAAWVLYVSDRLLDVKAAHSGKALRERHWFHARHQVKLVPVLAAAVLFLAWAVLHEMPRRVVVEDLVLGLAALLYFARVHLGARCGWKPLAVPRKEFLVGTIFAIAVAIPAFARSARPSLLLLPMLGFAALCCMNCLLIENAENATASRYTPRLLAGLAAVSFLAMLLPKAEHFLLLSIVLSAASLDVLWRNGRRLSPIAFRVSADAALLTPLFFLHWQHLS
jgi:hypothetical protein